MNTKTYNRTNFHRHTFCVFQEVALASIADMKVDYKSKSGSSYYFTQNGVYRLSNHWGRAANCKWRLAVESRNAARTKLGFALWTSFHPDNDTEKLYFISVDHEHFKVSYLHKNEEDFRIEFQLRTASETQKIIKMIRHLFDDTGWEKHFETENIAEVRRQIVEKLITSNLSLLKIKNEIRNTL